MQEARLWSEILAKARQAGATAVHLEPGVIRWQKNDSFIDAFTLTDDDFNNLWGWLEIVNPDWQNEDYYFKTDFYPVKAVIKILKKNNRYLNNLKGVYLVAGPKALQETLDYLAKKDLRVTDLAWQVNLDPSRGLTAGRAIDVLDSEVIVLDSLEDEEILERIAAKALIGKLILINQAVETEEEGRKYLSAQGLAPHLIESIWQGIIK